MNAPRLDRRKFLTIAGAAGVPSARAVPAPQAL